MPAYELKINGQVRKLDVAADTPLLWVLRDQLELVGTKFGCGISQCGACTVHLNGVPTRSCMTRVANVGEAAVTTIEGLSPDGSHPVQKAWVRLDVPQCGYCQAGQIMAAAALLAQNQKPSESDIDSAMGGNLCRCCTYPRIRRAVQEAAAAMRGEKLSDAAGVELTAGLASLNCTASGEVRA
jgi:isoquinoline 1-oxidoreductase subunit alpha